ncbi:MAG: hypothetical protein ACHQAQ_03615 [Hyphomicrobiales bacterium]
MRRGLNSPVGPGLRGARQALAATRIQRLDEINSRLPESKLAMLKINIPQHSEGRMIAAERAAYP